MIETIILVLMAIVAVFTVSFFTTYYIALFLFIVLMPLKNKYGDSTIFKLLAAIPFWIGFTLDIYWNVIHFSIMLYDFNRLDNIHKDKDFWPEFSQVKGVRTLYKITLTERLQDILATYPRYTRAYSYALRMAYKLNKYDPNHLFIGDERE
jgi:hypothetical protein